jgi:hypothetical protein
MDWSGLQCLRQAASGYPQSFGLTIYMLASSMILLSFRAHHLGVCGVCGGMLGIAVDVAEEYDAASGLEVGGRSTAWLAQAPSISNCPQLSAMHLFYLHNVNIVNMSRASQITLATTCATAIGVVAFVHFAQKQDKAVSQSHATHQDTISNYDL